MAPGRVIEERDRANILECYMFHANRFILAQRSAPSMDHGTLLQECVIQRGEEPAADGGIQKAVDGTDKDASGTHGIADVNASY